MKAWLIDSFTGLDGLRLNYVPDPIVQADEAILEIHYAALNPADRYLAEGQYPAKPPLPHILGRDGVGKVTQAAPGITEPPLGEQRAILRCEVGVSRPGAFAAKVAVPAESLVAIPAGWSDAE